MLLKHNQRFQGHPLLITSSVNVHSPASKLRNVWLRQSFTLQAISKWIKQVPGLNIILCDGSGHDFSHIISDKFPGLTIECLSFQNSYELVARYGVGYGEGEIINYALKNSALLNSAQYFVKCSAKLWLLNSRHLRLFDSKKDLTANFGFSTLDRLISSSPTYMDTRCYCVNRTFYHKYFESAYKEVSDIANNPLEAVMATRLSGLSSRMSDYCINYYPVFRGVSGSSFHHYDETPIETLRQAIKHRIKVGMLKTIKHHKLIEFRG